MTLYYCEGEKSAAIYAEMGEGVPDLLAASLISDALTALARLHIFGVCTFSFFCLAATQYWPCIDLCLGCYIYADTGNC